MTLVMVQIRPSHSFLFFRICWLCPISDCPNRLWYSDMRGVFVVSSYVMSIDQCHLYNNCCNHRFLIEVDCSLVINHNSKLNGFQTIQVSQVFLALLSSSEPSFEYEFNKRRAAVDLCTSWSIYLYISVVVTMYV